MYCSGTYGNVMMRLLSERVMRVSEEKKGIDTTDLKIIVDSDEWDEIEYVTLSGYTKDKSEVEFKARKSTIDSGYIYQKAKDHELDMSKWSGKYGKRWFLDEIKRVMNDKSETSTKLGFQHSGKTGKTRYIPNNGNKCNYQGRYDVRETGDVKKWINMVSDIKNICPELVFLVSVALSAPLLWLLRKKHYLSNVLVGIQYNENESYPENKADDIVLATLGVIASIFGCPNENTKKNWLMPKRIKVVKKGLVEVFDGNYASMFDGDSDRCGFVNCMYREGINGGTIKTQTVWNNKIYETVKSKSLYSKARTGMNTYFFNTAGDIVKSKRGWENESRMCLLKVDVKNCLKKSDINQIIKISNSNYGGFVRRYIHEVKNISLKKGIDGDTAELDERYDNCIREVQDRLKGYKISRKYQAIFTLAIMSLNIANIVIDKEMGNSNSTNKHRLSDKILFEQIVLMLEETNADTCDTDDIIEKLREKIIENHEAFDRQDITKAARPHKDDCIGNRYALRRKSGDANKRYRYVIRSDVFRKWIAESAGGDKKVLTIISALQDRHKDKRQTEYLETGPSNNRKAVRRTIKVNGESRYLWAYSLILEDRKEEVWESECATDKDKN